MSTITHLIVECYPHAGSKAFERYVFATVGCWVRHDIYAATTLDELVQAKLSAKGWSVARVVLREEVSAESYAVSREDSQYFEQAQSDGFVSKLYARAREWIGKGKEPPLSHNAQDIAPALAELEQNGGYSLFHSNEQTWASGVAPSGDEFVPLWATQEVASTWLDAWPNHAVTFIAADELRRGEFLRAIDASDKSVGVGIGSATLVTCHPLWVLADVNALV